LELKKQSGDYTLPLPDYSATRESRPQAASPRILACDMGWRGDGSTN